jgi:hypothetical protein
MLKITLLAWLVCTILVRAQAVLTPPFGLKWGDSPERLVEWAERHSLDVIITLPGKRPALRILRVQDEKGLLPSSTARAIEARFLAGRLFEVAVHYGLPTDPPDDVLARFEELKRKLATEYGELVPNQQDRKISDQFATRTLAFHREPVKGVFLMLAMTEIEDLLRQSRQATYSLIYRNDNFRQQLEAAGSPDGGAR